MTQKEQSWGCPGKVFRVRGGEENFPRNIPSNNEQMNKENERNRSRNQREKGWKIQTVWRHRWQREKNLSSKRELSTVSNTVKKTIKINLLDSLNMKPLKNVVKAFLWSCGVKCHIILLWAHEGDTRQRVSKRSCIKKLVCVISLESSQWGQQAPIDKKLQSVNDCKRVIWRKVNFWRQFLTFSAEKEKYTYWDQFNPNNQLAYILKQCYCIFHWLESDHLFELPQ